MKTSADVVKMERIYCLRKSGMSWNNIRIAMGLSETRVIQLYRQYEQELIKSDMRKERVYE